MTSAFDTQRHRTLAARIWLLLFLLSTCALAETESQAAAMKAAARELANDAADAFDAGNYESALEGFRKAGELYPAPTISLMEGRTLLQLRRWVEAFERFNEIARLKLDATASQAFQRAVQDAADAARRLEPQLPRLLLQAPSAPTVTVTLDGRKVPAPLLDVDRPIDPGEHVLRVAYRGSVYFEQTLDFRAGQSQVVRLPSPPAASGDDLARETVQADPVQEPALGAQAAVPSRAASSGAADWFAPAAFGVGGLGAGAATISLVLAAERKSRLDDVCDPGCPESARDDLESFRFQRTVFFVSAAVAVAGLGVGSYFTFWGDEGEELVVQVSPFGGALQARF